jgi:hypothetical protein
MPQHPGGVVSIGVHEHDLALDRPVAVCTHLDVETRGRCAYPAGVSEEPHWPADALGSTVRHARQPR